MVDLGGLFEDPALGETLAVAVMQGDRVTASRYGPGIDEDTTMISWSMAKSITHAVAGILVRQGRLDIHAPADVPEWTQTSDARHAITVDHLLRMSSGLAFTEDYVDAGVSDVIEMLFGSGQEDTGAFAAAFPLEHAPDTFWNYSSGTTNIISRLLGSIVGGGRPGMEEFLRAELFGPLGMTSATAGFDTAGTFVGSSYVYATAHDFLRFAALYRDGGRAILPSGWVSYARTPTPDSDDLSYGAHWWLRDKLFYAQGYEGQYLVVSPAADLVVVRLGKTPAELRPNVETRLWDLVDALS